MSTEDRQPPGLRVGGWVPPYAENGTVSYGGVFSEATTEVPHVVAAGAATRRDGRRRVLVVAGAALAVLGVTGVAVYETAGTTDAATARFVNLPTVPTVPAFPVPGPSVSASGHAAAGISGSAAASTRTKGKKSAPASAGASAAPSGSVAAPAVSSPGTAPATTTPAAPPPAPVVPSGPFVVGAAISLQPGGMGSYRVRHRDYRARVDRIASRNNALDRADSRFVVRAGLADASCVSFESSNYPGYFLRHRNGEVWLDRQTGGSLYAGDATFCAEERGPDTVVLRSHNYPSRYLAVRRSRIDLSSRATEFTVRSPL
ncbi:AbfB domain-containing protein [Symbioplanes lichenis]|uniref:AbfB domain-containing protein n=1 Tax=Symbioplanes lichenis TaxID=1629072 RepID=UPI00273A33DA|nr:AbfB domain-containing protein [Actinoplanes lichenis]